MRSYFKLWKKFFGSKFLSYMLMIFKVKTKTIIVSVLTYEKSHFWLWFLLYAKIEDRQEEKEK